MADEFQFPDEVEAKDESTNDEFEIEVVDDTPTKDRGRKPLEKEVSEPTDDELSSYSDTVKARINELTHARHDERRVKEAIAREKQELEQVAHRLLEENRQLKKYVNTGEQYYAETVKGAAATELEMAKRRYKEAYEAGDSDALVAAQEAMTEAKMRAEAAKNFKPTTLQDDDFSVQIPQAPQKPEIDDKTLNWQAKNQWFGAPGYEEITSFALGLHQKLVTSGVDPRSDDYFKRIDARLQKTFPELFEEAPRAEPQKKPMAVVAPATRSTGAKKIQLTSTQVALAKKFGLTPQQYALELAKMEKANG